MFPAVRARYLIVVSLPALYAQPNRRGLSILDERIEDKTATWAESLATDAPRAPKPSLTQCAAEALNSLG